MTKTNEEVAPAGPTPERPASAIEALQRDGREPLTIWKTKGPKNVGGLEIAAVLCQDDNSIVMTHTLSSGKWSIFVKAPV